MASLIMTVPDVLEFEPSLVLLLWDGFTGSNVLAGNVVVKIGATDPLFQKSPSEFVFGNLKNGNYSVSVESAPGQPYYLPVDIPISLPFSRPADLLWNPPPVWPGYPDIVLADPNKMLDDPEQTPAYLGQRALATLSPTTAYPFPSGTTLVRGVVTGAGVPLSGALVTASPLAQPGQLSVVVIDPTGVASVPQSLTVVQAPVIDSLDPAVVIAGIANFTLTAEGTGFLPGAVLNWNGAALPTTFLSGGGLAAPVSAAQITGPGQATVIAVNPDGTSSSPQKLTVAAAPAIASLDPPIVAAGSPAFTLVINGSGFTPAAAAKLNGLSAPTTWIRATQLNVQVGAAQVANAMRLTVVVTNPGPPPQTSNTQTLAVVSASVIDSLEPATVVVGSPAFTLTLGGSGFVTGATVKLGGVALPTQFQAANQLTAQVTAAQVASVGQSAITVANPNGAASSAQTLIVAAAPAISSLEPGATAAGRAAFGLVVRGSGFTSGSVVELNGTPLATSFVDSTELDAHVPRSGYTTGTDGTFVLFLDQMNVAGPTVTLSVSHPSYPNPKLVDVPVTRGATTSIDIEMSS